MSKTTKALAALPLGGKSESYSSESVRKISNGYIHSKSSSGPNGYTSSETFSPSLSEENLGAKCGPGEHKGSLAEAAGYLKGKS